LKAIALISGGLDSLLAARLIQEQGVGVVPLHFKIPFCQRDKGNLAAGDGAISRQVAGLKSELKTADISGEFLSLITNPRHGFGSNMNPCIDCKVLMLSKARELLPQFGASFVVTGEVLGQRPMSQHRNALELIEKESGLGGLLLRPLSARLLAETIPEEQGWVSRDKLLALNGRTRRPQIGLARAFNIRDYPNASGGCLLTDPEFSRRLAELIAQRELNMRNLELLKFGRHFRLAPQAKLIVGRDEGENNAILAMARDGDYLFMPPDAIAGPTSLGTGIFNEELIGLACSITCRYCDLNGKAAAEILYRKIPAAENKSFPALAFDKDRLADYRI